MRFIVFGVGAIGGTIAGKLAGADEEVIGIARGEQLRALQMHGLMLETPEGDEHSRFPVVGSPAEAGIRPGDAILLTMKTQDTAQALSHLRDAGVKDNPIVCVQNAVENERLALRLFPNVFGICVMLPASYLEPGVVRAYSTPRPGILDIGRYPRGKDKSCQEIAAALERAGFSSEADDDIMAQKYGKLLMNLGNSLQAALGTAARRGPYFEALRAEGEAALKAAGIKWGNADFDSPRRGNMMRIAPVKGHGHPGGSSWQSLARGAGSIETDYLNGEISLLGRLHGIPTPANDYFGALAAEMVRTGAPAGSIDPKRVERELKL
ncbi:MAG: 2-dehydropantoate 2-reductase N-terminal domain-containing protein [Alphaproteobacteria bacterium]